jgi:hypothetical protein
MERALRELQAGTWFSGLRRSQADTRRNTPVLKASGDVVKVHPIADWSNRDLHRYLRQRELPITALGRGLRVDRRPPHQSAAGRRHERAGHPLLRPAARVRIA